MPFSSSKSCKTRQEICNHIFYLQYLWVRIQFQRKFITTWTNFTLESLEIYFLTTPLCNITLVSCDKIVIIIYCLFPKGIIWVIITLLYKRFIIFILYFHLFSLSNFIQIVKCIRFSNKYNIVYDVRIQFNLCLGYIFCIITCSLWPFCSGESNLFCHARSCPNRWRCRALLFTAPNQIQQN